MKKRWIKKVPIAIAIGALGLIAFSAAVMFLWNGVLPAVFHIGTITIWQAMGILVLSKLLFGRRGARGHGGWRGKKLMFGKWEQMTPEEREMFSGRMRCRAHYAVKC
jgi:hypothetical protein